MVNYVKNKNNIYKIFVDNGNSVTKADCTLPNGETIRMEIPTLISKGEDKMSQDSYRIEDYLGDTYIVGDENKSVNVNINLSKMDLAHKLPTLVAIHQMVSDNAHVELYIGLPIQTFYNTTYRKECIEFYKKDKECTLTINNIKKSFTIDKVVALPESVGYVFNFPTDSLVGVIDIGYTTIDGAVYKDYAPILETVFSLVDGTNPFKTKVRDELNKELLLNIQPYQLDEILQKGLFGDLKEKADKIIYRCKMEYLKRIVNEMLKHSWEVQSLPIVFSGGGAILFKDIIEEYDTFQVSPNPLYDNLDGFKEMEVLLNE